MTTPPDGVLASAGVTLTFSWSGDRYLHHFLGAEGELRSTDEGDAESPVFTDLHQQGELLFLSGLSHDRHWSMSVEPVAKGLLMDVACRAKSMADGIGSCYAVPTRGLLRIVPDALSESPAPQVVADKQSTTVRPIGPFPEPPVTLRYRYRVESQKA